MATNPQLPRSGDGPRLTTFQPFSPGRWEGHAAPSYDWMVEGCLLRGTVAMLSGDGGLGKSLLMQQLLTAAAIGQPWLGLETKPCKVFGLFCEDDEDELHRRQEAINRHYGCSFADVGENALYISRVGMESALVEFDRYKDTPKLTPVLAQLKKSIRDFGAELIVLDTLADVFAGNEIVRNQVRRFVGEVRKIGMEAHGGVIMTAHPSNAGLSSGTGISGSTAWNNSVRSRMYLTRKRKPNEEEEEGDENNERFLRTMKNNQGPFGGKIRIRWDSGVFVRADQVEGSPSSLYAKLDADHRIMNALKSLVANGQLVAASTNQKSSFANALRLLPECKDLSYGFMVKAQERLLEAGRVARVELGPPSRRFVYLRPVDMLYPGEIGGGGA